MGGWSEVGRSILPYVGRAMGESLGEGLLVPMVSSPLAGGATVIMYIISVALPVPKILVRRSCMRCWFFLPAAVFLLLVIFSGT